LCVRFCLLHLCGSLFGGPTNLFPSGKAEIAGQTRQVFSS
jgi:hypothetical protein